jgi:hypothetical protein
MSATPDSTLSNTEKLMADLQRQLAECKAERDAGLERETAIAEVLQVINSSPGDLAPVFDAMLDRAMRLCEASYGHFRTYDGNRFPLVATCGDERLAAWFQQHGALAPSPDNPATRFVRGEDLVHLPDAMDSEAYRADATFRQFVETGACRAMLSVAL